jgi:hypothetical protein
MPGGDSMPLTLDYAVAYMRKHGIYVTEEDIERALQNLELPALAGELGDDPYWIVPPEYFHIIRNGGGAEVKLAYSVWDRNKGHFQVKGPEAKFMPVIFVSSDALDQWAIRLNDPGRQETVKPAPNWQMRKASRERTYVPYLREYLQGALARGEPLPAALDVLRAWRDNPPHGISVSKDLRFFTYAVDGEKISVKETSARNLGKAIGNHAELKNAE